MQSKNNKAIVACAGSGKTTRLVAEASASRERKIAVITYTNNNAREIFLKFARLNSCVPQHVDVMTWYSFLLRECARPYQRSKYNEKRIRSLLFVNRQSTKGIPESDTGRYYFSGGELIYSDKISRFVIESEEKSSGSVTARLGQIYSDIYIDECQDLAAWDWEFIGVLMRSGVRIVLVGDPRQSILRTNVARKNKRYRNCGVYELLEEWEEAGLCKIETMSETHRCNSEICDFANLLWPGMEDMTSLACTKTNHDGVFLVAESAVEEYCRNFHPQVLHRDKRAKTYGFPGMNFGVAKGAQFGRVLIVPTGPIKKYLESGDPHPLKEKEKLHVAITRARHSVAFVFNGQSVIVPNRWTA